MNNLPLVAHLAQFPLLASLRTSELERLAAESEYLRCSKGAYIYLADEPSTFLCFLLKGSVKIGMYASDGRELIKSIQHPFHVFGEMGLSGEESRPEFACAISKEVLYFKVPLPVFTALMNENFQLTRDLANHFGERVRKAERQCESLVLKDVRTRIVEFLKQNANEHGRQVGLERMIKHGLTQQDIANLVGASRQTVAAIMNELRKSNLIHFNRNTILIRDMDKLN